MPSRKKDLRATKTDSQTIVLRSSETEAEMRDKAHVALSVLREANGMHAVGVVAAANKRLAAYLA